MMSELTQVGDTARLLKSKRGYRHFGKLDQTASALQARADELRRVRREMSAPRVTSASDVASLQQYIDEQAAVIEQVKRECRRHQAAGRAHRDAAAALAAGVEHQREARDRLSRKVAETRQAIAEKKRSYPEAELRLTDRLRLLETETRTNLSETAQLAREEDEEVEGLRKEVAHASALVQSGEQDLLEKEALVLRLTEALAARRADAPDARPARAAGAHRMEAEIRFESMRAEETRAHDEKMTALRGRLGGLEAEAGTLRATLAHEAADHASRLKDLAERASNRRDVLVSALHGGIAGGGGGKSEPARRDSPVVPGSPVPPAFSSTFPPPGGDGEDAVEQEIAVGGALGAAVCSDVVSLSSGSNHRAATDEPEGDVPDAAKRGGGEIQRSEAGDQTQQRSEEERAAFDGSEAPTVVPQAALSPITRAETTPADRSLASDESGHDGSYKTVTTVQRRATPVLPADADSDPSNAPQPAAPAAARSRSSNSSFEVFEDSDDDIAI
ncbi:hypothetical protein DIPPA_02149 [Diplonema papillatum]|nr:hypothetical protein DIPPA_02149 [Diplonema papillatum]